VGDRIGLIGINGSGKTTLLRIIAGQETADEGQVTVWGGVRIRFLPQMPQLNPQATVLDQLFDSNSPQIRLLRDYEQTSHRLQTKPHDPQLQDQLAHLAGEMERTNGWAAEANVKAILTRLGITDFQAPIASLSGGQQKRVALAQGLIDPADLLILDEPTNHIDAETIDWLENYLLTVPNALLLVTHDRYFLDRVVNRIIELDRREIVSYPGNYGRYLSQRDARDERLADDEAKRQKLLKQELEWLRRAPMARGTKQKARQQRVEVLQTIGYDRSDKRVVMALAGRRLGKQVLTASGLSKSYGDLTLFHDLDFELAPDDRIGIIGPNGAGKSTLLDILAGYSQADAGQVQWGETVHLAYYDQQNRGLQTAVERNLRVIDFINEEAPLILTDEGERVEAAKMLEWFLFPRPQQQARLQALSGGERRRLYLLSLLVHRPNVLLLDEPTNDLDIPTLNVLEQFLDHFAGAVVVVSHDRYFLDRTVDFLAAFENGRFSSRHPAPFSNYQRLRQLEQTPAPIPQPPTPIPQSPTPNPQSPTPKLSWKEQRELETLNSRIEQLEKEQVAVKTAVNQAGDDYLQLQQLATRLGEMEAELEGLMERWLELSERVQA
jgi:ABC transport system ATP-binding/permease protein